MNQEKLDKNETEEKLKLKKKPVIKILDENEERVFASEVGIGCGYCKDIC